MKVKIIFDKDKSNNRLELGWGISYLIGNTLFDTGEKSEYLAHNLKILNIDIKKIENIVISHRHWNHLGGLWQLLKLKADIKVYACGDFIEKFREEIGKYNFFAIKDFQEIDKGIYPVRKKASPYGRGQKNTARMGFKIPSELSNGVYTSGCLKTIYKDSELLEQALIVKTAKGVSIVCACAHPGILKMLQRVREYFPKEKLYCIFGGFHLIDADMRLVKYIVDEIKKIGVEKVGPAHCTGYEASAIFRKVYGNNFLEIQAGKEFEI